MIVCQTYVLKLSLISQSTPKDIQMSWGNFQVESRFCICVAIVAAANSKSAKGVVAHVRGILSKLTPAMIMECIFQQEVIPSICLRIRGPRATHKQLCVKLWPMLLYYWHPPFHHLERSAARTRSQREFLLERYAEVEPIGKRLHRQPRGSVAEHAHVPSQFDTPRSVRQSVQTLCYRYCFWCATSPINLQREKLLCHLAHRARWFRCPL